MGKGQCFGTFLDPVPIARTIFACICLVCCSGPILFIVGIVIVATPNNREDNIHAYNIRVALWASGDLAAMNASTTSFTSQGPMSKAVSAVVPSGNCDGVEPAQSVYYNAAVRTASSISLSTRNQNAGNDLSVYDIARSMTDQYSLECTGSGSGSCQVSDANCRSGYSYDGWRLCNKGETCGKCTRTLYLSRICVIVWQVSGVWQQHPTLRGCHYPFELNDYEATFSQFYVPLEVRSWQDPYIALEQITQGSDNFGLTAGQQIALGMGLMAVGIIISAGLVACLLFTWRHQPARRRGALFLYTVMGRPVLPHNTLDQPLYSESMVGVPVQPSPSDAPPTSQK